MAGGGSTPSRSGKSAARCSTTARRSSNSNNSTSPSEPPALPAPGHEAQGGKQHHAAAAVAALPTPEDDLAHAVKGGGTKTPLFNEVINEEDCGQNDWELSTYTNIMDVWSDPHDENHNTPVEFGSE